MLKPCIIALSLALSGCAATGGGNSSYGDTYQRGQAMETGRIDSIQFVHGGSGTSGAGAAIGGVIGALAGNQVGGGSGRTAATIAGAAGGAIIGNQVEAQRQAGQRAQIGIRLDQGGYRTVLQDDASGLRIGDHVRIIDGRAVRD